MAKVLMQQFDIIFTGDDRRLLDFGYRSYVLIFLFTTNQPIFTMSARLQQYNPS
jgi:hypothetical protein